MAIQNKKLATILALLAKKQVVIPAAILIGIALTALLAVKISASLNLTIKPSYTINPDITLDFSELRCGSNSASLSTQITKPQSNSTFLTTDKIDFTATETYSCSDKPQFTYSWVLDGNQFSTDKDVASLNNLAVGSHTVKYNVKGNGLSSESSVTFQVKAPEVKGVSTTKPTTPTPPTIVNNVQCNVTCNSTHLCATGLSCISGVCRLPSNPSSTTCQAVIPNKLPVVNITDWYSSNESDPKNGLKYGTDNYECVNMVGETCMEYRNFTYFYLEGTATDPDGDTMTRSWYYNLNGSSTQTSIGGNVDSLSRVKLYAPANCSGQVEDGYYYYNSYKIFFKAVDSKGASTTSNITVHIRMNCG